MQANSLYVLFHNDHGIFKILPWRGVHMLDDERHTNPEIHAEPGGVFGTSNQFQKTGLGGPWSPIYKPSGWRYKPQIFRVVEKLRSTSPLSFLSFFPLLRSLFESSLKVNPSTRSLRISNFAFYFYFILNHFALWSFLISFFDLAFVLDGDWIIYFYIMIRKFLYKFDSD